ncbi:unnamed protein product, partial [Schistosoma turkestanicum]
NIFQPQDLTTATSEWIDITTSGNTEDHKSISQSEHVTTVTIITVSSTVPFLFIFLIGIFLCYCYRHL